MTAKAQASRIPKFGDWQAENSEQPAFTLIFDTARDERGARIINPNDPEFLAIFSSNQTSASAHEDLYDNHHRHHHLSISSSPSSSLKGTSPSHTRSSANRKERVTTPKFGDWDVKNPQQYTLVFDDMKEQKQSSIRSTPQRIPGTKEEKQKPTSIPKFGDWDVKNPQQYTLIFDDVKEQKQSSIRSTPQRTPMYSFTKEEKQKPTSIPQRTKPVSNTNPQVSTHKPSLLVKHWRRCFGAYDFVKD